MSEFGFPEFLVLRGIEALRVKAGEVLIKFAYAGVNLADTYMRHGYYGPPHAYAICLPLTPGVDGVGRNAEIGAGVSGFSSDCVRQLDDLAENRSTFVTHSHPTHYMTFPMARRSPGRARRCLRHIVPANLKAAMYLRTLTLAQAVEAHRAIESRASTTMVLSQVA